MKFLLFFELVEGVMVINVLEWMEYLWLVLKELYWVVKIGGYVCVGIFGLIV